MPAPIIQARKRKKSPVVPILVILILTGIILGAAVVFFSMSSAKPAVEEAGIPLSCYISGNDIVVVIDKDIPMDHVYAIELIIDGYTLPPGYSTKEIQQGNFQKIITYREMVAGLYGSIHAGFRAHYFDGAVKTIWAGTIRIT